MIRCRVVLLASWWIACGSEPTSAPSVPPPAPVPAPPVVAPPAPPAPVPAQPAVATPAPPSPPVSSPSPSPRRESPCPPGTCIVRPGGRCERPTGQLGNACCRCGANGRCASPCRCNGPDLPVATPGGPRAIASLRPGDLVDSLHDGRRVAVPVREVRTRVAPEDGFVRVELADGTTFVTSAVHPLADGRTVEALAGDPRVRRVTPARRPSDRTWDLLPASDSGVYFVGPFAFASTLDACR